jgi:hypothetical protein
MQISFPDSRENVVSRQSNDETTIQPTKQTATLELTAQFVIDLQVSHGCIAHAVGEVSS